MNQSITVETTINAPVEKVWDFYTQPEHIVNWNNPSDDWTTTKAENDLRAGGKFLSRMEAKDGSAGFDFGGTYDEVIEHSLIKYTMGDGRKVAVIMSGHSDHAHIAVTFDLENENTPELQRSGWQAILDNFRSYVEGH